MAASYIQNHLTVIHTAGRNAPFCGDLAVVEVGEVKVCVNGKGTHSHKTIVNVVYARRAGGSSQSVQTVGVSC